MQVLLAAAGLFEVKFYYAEVWHQCGYNLGADRLRAVQYSLYQGDCNTKVLSHIFIKHLGNNDVLIQVCTYSYNTD